MSGEGGKYLNVVPTNDHIPHLMNEECVCGPKFEEFKDNDHISGLFLIHNSLDGREFVERQTTEPVDSGESSEVTIQRMAYQIMELENWKMKYQQAAKCWDDLDLEDGQYVPGALFIAKIVDINDGVTGLGLGATEGLDWITRVGLLAAAQQVDNDWGTTARMENNEEE